MDDDEQFEFSRFSLYEDPLQNQKNIIPHTGIGFQLIPNSYNIWDPVLIRHILCLMNIISNLFHVMLCMRQLHICSDEKNKPPPLLGAALTAVIFDATRTEEMYNVNQAMLNYIFDSIFCCIELYMSIYPSLWKLVIICYSTVDDMIWLNIAFAFIFSTYVVVRHLPQMVYSKLMLTSVYTVDENKSLPLVGLLCMCSLLVVLVQVVVVPVVTVLLLIEKNGGKHFVAWIWAFLLIMSIVGLIVFSIYGIPLITKRKRMAEDPATNALAPLLRLFNFPTDRIFIVKSYDINVSRAYAFGCGAFKRIFIYDTLLMNLGKPQDELHPSEVGKGLNTNELVAYIVHALFHWRYHHVVKLFFIIHIIIFLYMFVFSLCYEHGTIYMAAGFSFESYPPIIGYWMVYKFVMPIYLIFSNCFISYFVRKFEYTADKETVKLGYGTKLIDALIKLYHDNPVYPYRDTWYQSYHYFLPSSLKRIEEIKKINMNANQSQESGLKRPLE